MTDQNLFVRAPVRVMIRVPWAGELKLQVGDHGPPVIGPEIIISAHLVLHSQATSTSRCSTLILDGLKKQCICGPRFMGIGAVS